MRILISGVAGFLGSHLASLLVSQKHEVVGVDNFATGRRETVEALGAEAGFSFVEGDVTGPVRIDGPVDRVYHMATPSSAVVHGERKIAMLKANSEGTWNLLELALEKGARFLLASSSECYGDPKVHPQREDYWGDVCPIGVRCVGEEATRFAEACTMTYQRARGADTRIARIFNTYGPGMDPRDGRAVISFIRQALSDEPLTVFGDGRQTRSLCYVADMVQGVQMVMECDFHEPINLGSPEEVEILQIAREVRELVWGTKSQIVHQPGTPEDPRVRCPDVTRAKQLVGWVPRVSRKDGLARMIEHYREQMKKG